MFERRLFYHIDWPTIVALGALCATGVAMIYATTHTGANAGLWVKQLYAVAVGLVAFAVCLTIDYRRLADNSVVFYVVIVLLLIAVLLFGAKGGGARRWIPLPGTSPCSPPSSRSSASRCCWPSSSTTAAAEARRRSTWPSAPRSPPSRSC